MRLAAGTSINAVAETIDFLLDQTIVITGRDVYENTPAEFRRLGFAVSLLSLAITHGELDASGGEISSQYYDQAQQPVGQSNQ